ncbi:hypothetical protein SLA2020_224750 [Shorea laevis]
MEVFPQPSFSSTFVCIIIIFSTLLLLRPSYSDLLDEFIECNRSASFECGTHGTFYYPLWTNSTPGHCHPLGFHLKDCEKEVPTIDFGPDGSFLLQHANPSNYTLTIAPMNFKEYICPETTQNRALLLPFLKFSEINKILTLFYNCTPPAEVLPANTIADCGPNENNTAFNMNDSELERYNYSECSTARVAVNQTAFNNLQERKMRLDDALRDGWSDVKYNSSAVLCHQCESLDGICRSLVQYPNITFCQRRPGRPGMDNLRKTVCF